MELNSLVQPIAKGQNCYGTVTLSSGVAKPRYFSPSWGVCEISGTATTGATATCRSMGLLARWLGNSPLVSRRAQYSSCGRPTTRAKLTHSSSSLGSSFAVDSHQFSVRAKVWNVGQCAMPASFGFHPAFRWPILGAPSRKDHVVVFGGNEDPTVYRIAQSGLLRSTNEQPVKGRVISLSDDLFLRDALILDDLKSQSLAYGAKGHRKIRLEVKGCRSRVSGVNLTQVSSASIRGRASTTSKSSAATYSTSLGLS